MNKCSRCKSTNLTERYEPDTFNRKGFEFTVNVYHTQCNDCGNEFIPVEQIRKNDEILETEWQIINRF